MKLSVSNIGWIAEKDKQVYELMVRYGYSGLEIAPTRVFPENPYEKDNEAGGWSKNLKKKYGFYISSMQSIWYGRQEKLFGSEEERKILFNYTKKGIDFAAAIECKNLVFGCPKNRNMPEGASPAIAVKFFRELGNYAAACGTVIGMEANPLIYHTNYINDTLAAIALIKEVNSKGFLLNLDIGTMIQNNEDITELKGKVNFINHVHISEPGLAPIKERFMHKELKKILDSENYMGFISVEMGKFDDILALENSLQYVRAIFG